jgi:ATP-binding cassette subfamily F protein 3
VTANKQDWQARKEEQAALRKKQNDLKRVEERIEQLEAELAAIDEELTHEDVFANVEKLMELQKQRDGVSAQLEELYERWEELA